MDKKSLFAEVIVPVPVSGTFTYLIVDDEAGRAKAGMRVIVPFGKKKKYTGIIASIVEELPNHSFEYKSIHEIVDKAPLVLPSQIELWKWISTYYMCSIGEVCKAAIPSCLIPESETVLFPVEEVYPPDILSEKERNILDRINSVKGTTIDQLIRSYRQPGIMKTVLQMLAENLIRTDESIVSGFKARTEWMVKPGSLMPEENNLNEVFDRLRRAPRQTELLLKYFEIPIEIRGTRDGIPKKLLTGNSLELKSALKSLKEKGLFQLWQKETSRLTPSERDPEQISVLSEDQALAFHEINQLWKDHPVVLLHGITGSGKTEIYFQLIDKVIAEGKQVLYLLPEIAITNQMIRRIQRFFGDRAGVYHSGFPAAERAEIWKQMLEQGNGGYQIVLGVRSSVFLPFHNLGLVIIDEEHENTYKQQSPAPRYHARDVAIMLALQTGARTIAGSATPSIDSYFNTQIGKYGLVNLKRRYGESMLPEIIVSDIRKAKLKKQMQSHFSPELIRSMQDALSGGRQVILFQNRRGFAPYLICDDCGWIPKCNRCDVSLTWHKGLQKLVCHYCGASKRYPVKCEECGGKQPELRGFGTEKIEEEIALLFPDHPISRFDQDTTRGRYSGLRILEDFETGRTSILVGTQMVSKGLDFENVTLAGILDADSLLGFPDFRASERSFQLMSQVAGRAGRRVDPGKVIIQSRDPEHPVIKDVKGHNYLAMYLRELEERREFRYPPWFRLIMVTTSHRNPELLNSGSTELARKLTQIKGIDVAGPVSPLVGKIANVYYRQILLRISRQVSSNMIRSSILQATDEIKSINEFKSIRIAFDVDPV
jgi:primosomal protein N' (replication factor Y) (superfamily II helicase)